MIDNYNEMLINNQNPVNLNFSEEVLYRKLAMENENILNFLTNISHDIRTPISVILNTIKVLSLHLNNSKNTNDIQSNNQKYLNIIQQNSYRMLRLFNSILEVVKIESGVEELSLQNYDIVNVVSNICLSINQLGKNNDITLIFQSAMESKVVAFDPDKIERVILNLLTNSFKYTQPGGKITVSLYEEADNIVVSVKDTGTGIPREKLDCIFRKFHNDDGKIYDNMYCKGIGVGLYIVKEFVELHNGKIKVSSQEGKGTEFIISIPIALVDENMNTSCSNNEIVNSKIIENINIEFADVYKLNDSSIHNQTAG
ncbi:MAG: sensor histidine kinase [Ignavibacteriales bacterium]